MKTYKFKFTKTIIALLSVALLLCVAGFGLNIYRMTKFENPTTYSIITAILMMFVTLVFAIIIISLFFNTKYVVDEKKIVSVFGIVKSEILLKDISSITHYKKSNKLVVTFSENKYSVIVVKENWYDDFIETILKFNPKIEYAVDSVEKNDDTSSKKNNKDDDDEDKKDK